MSAQDGPDGDQSGREISRGRRGRVDRLLGAPATPSPAPVSGPRAEAPVAVRRAALVAGVESALLAALAGVLLYLTLTSEAKGGLGSALGLVVLAAVAAAGLAVAAVGLWRVSEWARGPVIAMQVFLGLGAFFTAFQGGRPLFGLPLLVLVAAELYLLATPEARLAYLEK